MKLPIGIQTFTEIRNGNYLYIDKTEQIHRVLSSGKYFFLSRPRRFGKSLMLSTMKSLYEGQKDLFEGLWIADKWDWEKQFPVIHIQFSKADYQEKGLGQAIWDELDDNANRLGLFLEQKTFKSRFEELIRKASLTNKVVILIDEYDKPIIDYLDDIPQANINRKILKSFYSVLKDSDPYLELVFITGVSRFAKTSIFSDLNNLQNLTMDQSAIDLLGITYKEVDFYFLEHLKQLANNNNVVFEKFYEQMRYWYNGYSWDGITKVYNPFSLLSFMKAGQFQNYWFETGTPTFLVEAMKKESFYKIDKIEVPDSVLDTFDIENINPLTVLFQAGYITVTKKHEMWGVYQLEYPNNEVKVSLEERLLNRFAHDRMGKGRVNALHLCRALQKGDIDQMVVVLNAVFASIPYQLWEKENEKSFHALIHLTFSLMGLFIQSEVNSSDGRLDSIIHTTDTIYILEFKLAQSPEIALQQIRDKAYFAPYMTSPKKRIGIGINFSKEKKKVDGFEVAEF